MSDNMYIIFNRFAIINGNKIFEVNNYDTLIIAMYNPNEKTLHAAMISFNNQRIIVLLN